MILEDCSFSGMACTTSDQRTSDNVPMAALCKNHRSYLQFLIFFQLEFVWEKLKTRVTSASTKYTTTNGDRSMEFTESFLVVCRYLNFDNG